MQLNCYVSCVIRLFAHFDVSISPGNIWYGNKSNISNISKFYISNEIYSSFDIYFLEKAVHTNRKILDYLRFFYNKLYCLAD